MFIFINILLMLDKVESFRTGECSKFDSSGKEIWFCCNNHETVNGTCIECLNGFESLDGSTCKPCPTGLFGKECLETCYCKKTECNHIQGCINIQHNWTGETKESTMPLTNTPTLREYSSSGFSTFLSAAMKLYTLSGTTSTVMISTRGLKITSPKSKANDLGLNNREVVVYSISAGTFAFFILMCILCLNRYKKIYGKRYQTGSRRRVNVTENIQPESHLEEICGLYEMIDETNMIDNFQDHRDNNLSVSDTNGSYVQPDNNDYLTPYQPTDEDANTNNSNDIESESSASIDGNNRPASNHESTSSSSDIQGRRSSYLNPYQSIVQSVDVHEYSSTHNIDNSVLLGPIALTKESCSLNTVQPMIQVSKLLDSTYVIGTADESSSLMPDTSPKELEVKFSYPYKDVTLEIEPLEYKPVKDISSNTVSTKLDTKGEDSIERKLTIYRASSNEI